MREGRKREDLHKCKMHLLCALHTGTCNEIIWIIEFLSLSRGWLLLVDFYASNFKETVKDILINAGVLIKVLLI